MCSSILVRSAPMATPTMVQGSVPLAPSVQLSLLGDRNDPRVAEVVLRVNRARLEMLARTYRELGLSPDQAAARARVAYAAILGLLHLAQTNPDAPDAAVLADAATEVFIS